MTLNPGRLVMTTSMKMGIVHNIDLPEESTKDTKVPVYIVDGDYKKTGEKKFCLINNLELIGYTN